MVNFYFNAFPCFINCFYYSS